MFGPDRSASCMDATQDGTRAHERAPTRLGSKGCKGSIRLRRRCVPRCLGDLHGTDCQSCPPVASRINHARPNGSSLGFACHILTCGYSLDSNTDPPGSMCKEPSLEKEKGPFINNSRKVANGGSDVETCVPDARTVGITRLGAISMGFASQHSARTVIGTVIGTGDPRLRRCGTVRVTGETATRPPSIHCAVPGKGESVPAEDTADARRHLYHVPTVVRFVGRKVATVKRTNRRRYAYWPAILDSADALGEDAARQISVTSHLL
jgi:hypothetical protein